jgi:hypothetical protein
LLSFSPTLILRSMDKNRHLKAVESIDTGLAEAEQITIEDGVRAAVEAGRLGVGEAVEILAVFEHRFQTPNVVELRPDYPDGAA